MKNLSSLFLLLIFSTSLSAQIVIRGAEDESNQTRQKVGNDNVGITIDSKKSEDALENQRQTIQTTTKEVENDVREVKTTVTTPDRSKRYTTPIGSSTTTAKPVQSTPTNTYTAPSTRPVQTTTTTRSYNPPSTSTRTVSAGMTEDVPPNAEPGKCYARCFIPDQYDYREVRVIDRPQIVKKVKLPRLTKQVYDTVVVTPKSSQTMRVPAEYETIEERIMVEPATTKWVKGKADAGCLSADPKDCQVMCLVEVPAKYKTVTRKVLKNEAYTRSVEVPMEYKIVAKEIVVREESYQDIVIPATYKTIQERYVVREGGYQDWREVLCGDQLTVDRIRQIQRALKANGYDPGPIDNILGSRTKAALTKYQRDNGLPVGNLNVETLRALGVQ